MNKTAIKNFAVWARKKLIADINYKAGLMGITEDGIKMALPQSTRDMEFYDIGTKEPYVISGEAVHQRKRLAMLINQKVESSDYKTAYRSVVEEVAYTWFNRLIAIRFMEVNDYLPSHIRVLSSESGTKLEPDLVTTPFDADLELSDYEQSEIIRLKNENKVDELFHMLFIKQCNALNEILPKLFEKTSDYTELLLNVSVTDQDSVVYHLVHDIPEDDFNIEKGGQVEIIGWLYQYYNTEPKDEAFALLKKNVKITKERIPAATQLFTPDWIVRYMVENSLGRLWLEGHPNPDLKASWKYYLDEAEQEADVQAQLEKIREEYRTIKPEDIKVIDPCMGSGHILVYAFDVLMQIYETEGYTQREAAKSILDNNIYGLDIDDRAFQLAYFAVMMKARQYNRRILSKDTVCHVYSIQDSNTINRSQLKYFGVGLNESERIDAMNQTIGLLDIFTDAKEYGSILNVHECNWSLLRQFLSQVNNEGQMTLDLVGIDDTQNQLKVLISNAEVMAQTYDVIITNPPYMGDMNSDLQAFAKQYYPNSKHDLCTMFIERCLAMIKKNRFLAMITQNAFMFLSRYEKFRLSLFNNTFINMAHLGSKAFDSIGGEVVQTTAFCILKTFIPQYMTVYERLVDYQSEEEKRLAYMRHDMYYKCKSEQFYRIPRTPMTYWVSEHVIRMFNADRLDTLADPRVGMFTTDNNKYLREWWEPSYTKIGFNFSDKSTAYASGFKWFPYNKGGGFRRWYGNVDLVVNWQHGGEEIKSVVLEKYPYLKGNYDFVLKTDNPYFKPGITWSGLTSGANSFRICGNGFLFDTNKGAMIFEKSLDLYYLLGFLNSKVAQLAIDLLNSTISLQIGDVAAIPIIVSSKHYDKIRQLSITCVNNCKDDWNSRETAWEFIKHPIIDGSKTLEQAFDKWKKTVQSKFDEVKKSEEILNQLFIEVYDLKSDVNPEVEDDDVSIVIPNVEDAVHSFISYAIGCMFGRYSLDVPGLAYAGGEWDASKYSSFIPDEDNIIPITDEEYFQDDIVCQFCGWLKKVYGEETLEENLDFIAKALGNKGNTSREVIRNYFLNDFIKDHIKTYQKRPIYWLFDSGKQNGFKALIYMHRYDENTIGNLRIDYLHHMERIYESEIARMQDIIDNSSDAREVTKATKRKEKLQKQVKECKEYDEKIAHLALARISIDLDDGVKVNYEKVQTVDGKKYQVLAKI